MRRHINRILTVLTVAALPLAVNTAIADAKKGVTEAELKYQAGSSPLAGVEMHQDIKELRRAGLVSERKAGRWVHFGLAEEPAARAWISAALAAAGDDRQLAADARLVAVLRPAGRGPVPVRLRPDRPRKGPRRGGWALN